MSIISSRIKILVDIIMTILFFVLMNYYFTGRTIHEYLGYLIFIFFVLHHILNFNWYKNLTKGKYSLNRSLNTFINTMLLICMLGLIISGILFNKDVVNFFNLTNIKVFNKKLHIVCSHWGFILMSIHLGMHWGMFINMSKKFINIKKTNIHNNRFINSYIWNSFIYKKRFLYSNVCNCKSS